MDLFNIFFYLVIFLTGLCFGSFLNVLIYRIPRKLSVVSPPSACPVCSERLRAGELVPLFAFLVLRGKCRHCGAKISFRYPLIELFNGLLFTIVLYYFGLNVTALFYLALLYILAGIALIDLEHRLIPNSLVIAGIIMAAIIQVPAFLQTWFRVNPLLLTGRDPADSLFGFLAGGAVLLVVFLVSRGGMGAGDVKLIAMIGLYAGLRATAAVLLLAFLFGALTGLALIAAGKLTRKDALPFAPFLSLAAYIEVFCGNQIWNWYINLFS